MFKKTIFSFIASAVSVVAILAVQPTSLVTIYQPKVPKVLQK
ncbi:cyclic lactone autoinducer peptide [Desulfitobacterium sp. AusDCA]